MTASDFGKLFSEYSPCFISIAYRYVRDRSVAQDIVSESFMAFWEAQENLPADVNVPAYILTIVKNKCLNHLRTQSQRLKIEKKLHTMQERLLQVDIGSLSVCDPENLISKEIYSAFEKAVGTMPELTRKVYIGNHFEGKSYKEIAAEQKIAVTHVNFEMRKAFHILRIALKDHLPSFLCFVFPSFFSGV